MDITNTSIIELKALAYDRLAQIETLQQDLIMLNDQIAKKAKEVATEPAGTREEQEA